MTDRLQASSMTPYVGSAFDVLDGTPEVFPLRLTGVVELVNTEKHQSFSLVFRGPLDRFLPQRIYKLKHLNLEELEIFLVPISRDKDGFEYEAVFNYIS